MSAHRRCTVFGLGVAIALAAHVERAQAIGTDFDRFLVTDLATGAVLLDTTVSADGSAHYASVRSEFGGGALRTAVTLTEPAGQPPGENPICLPGTSLVVSDSVVFVTNRTDPLNPATRRRPPRVGILDQFGRETLAILGEGAPSTSSATWRPRLRRPPGARRRFPDGSCGHVPVVRTTRKRALPLIMRS